MAAGSRPALREASTGFLLALDTKSKRVSIHGLVGSDPLHLLMAFFTSGLRWIDSSFIVSRSDLAWAEPGPGGGGTEMALPEAITHVCQLPALGSADRAM